MFREKAGSQGSVFTGISVQRNGRFTGISVQRSGRFTGISVQRSGRFTGISVQRSGRFTGISVQRSGRFTGISVQRSGRFTGISVQRNGRFTGINNNSETKAVELLFIVCATILCRTLNPVGKYLFKVSKITLEQRPSGRCSNAILLTLNRYLPTGKLHADFLLLLFFLFLGKSTWNLLFPK